MRRLVRILTYTFLSMFLYKCSFFDTAKDALSSPHTYILEGESLYDYQPDMFISLEGSNYIGATATLLTDRGVDITIVSKAKLDMLVVATCHRYEPYRKIDKNWFGGTGKEFKYKFQPRDIELRSACPLVFLAYDENGLTDWGLVAFRTDEFLPAESECNGQLWSFKGFTVCPALNETIQTMKFREPVVSYRSTGSCSTTTEDKKKFKIKVGSGWCYLTFYDGVNWHSAIFSGYKRAHLR